MKNYSFIRKCLYSIFQLHSNCVSKPIIVSVKITTKIFKVYSFSMKVHNYIRYVVQISSGLSENISTSFFNYIIICMPTIVSVKIMTKIIKFLQFHMNFHNLIRNGIQKSSVLSENVTTFFRFFSRQGFSV